MQGISVLLPTLNEAENIGECLCRITEALEGFSSWEVVLADDSSSDATAEIAREASRDHRFDLRVIERTGEPSLSRAVVKAAKSARFDVVCVLDADLSHDPASIPEVAGPVLAGRVGVSIGSRYAEGGTVAADWPLARRLASRAGTSVARRLSGVRDPLSGFFACRRGLLDGRDLALEPRGYKILLELLARGRGCFGVCEVPIVFRDRTRGSSKLGARQLLQFAAQCFAIVRARLSVPRAVPAAHGTSSSARSSR